MFLLGLGLLAASVIAPTAGAGKFASSAPSCSSQVYEQPFTRWLDPASYVLVPGGTFESGVGGWQLKGTSIVTGNESFYVHGAGESRALSIPSGASATTQPMCATLLHPDLRFFVRNTGNPLGLLKVDVMFEDLFGNVQSLPIGVVAAGRSWSPTLPLPFLVNALAALNRDGTTTIGFRFTSTLGGAFQIDDVYVDPYRSA